MALSKIEANSLATAAVRGRKNLLINGAMQINQYGSSSTSIGRQTLDRFFTIASTDATLTQSQTALTSGDPYDEGFRFVYRQQATTASSSPATNHYVGWEYRIEAQDLAQSGWNYTSTSSHVTLSFWVKSSVAGTYTASLRPQDGTQQNQSFEYTLVADTWKKVTHTFTGDSNITINNDAGIGAKLYIWVHLGTNYTAADAVYDAWTTYDSGKQSQDFAQNWTTTSNATFDITGVQLEVSEFPTVFEHRSFAEDLALCHRYYVRMTDDTSQSSIAYGRGAGSGQNVVAAAPIPVPLRASPTITSTGAYHASDSNSRTSFTPTSVVASGFNKFSNNLGLYFAAGTTICDDDRVTLVGGNGNTTLEISAEL